MKTQISAAALKRRMRLGAELSDWLDLWGYSPRTFADRCGIDARRVRDWMRGERSPPILLPVVLKFLEMERVDGESRKVRLGPAGE